MMGVSEFIGIKYAAVRPSIGIPFKGFCQQLLVAHPGVFRDFLAEPCIGFENRRDKPVMRQFVKTLPLLTAIVG